MTTTDQESETVAHFPLRLEKITRRFGSVTALDDVSLTLERGSVHALLGENGAGKTTLMRVAFGLTQPDSGRIFIDGKVSTISSPADAIRAGIGMVHQQFSLIPAMTVAENVALGGHGRFNATTAAVAIAELGEKTGLRLDPYEKVSALSPAGRQKLEILRTLARNARVMILDEPTAVLTERDIGELFAQIEQFSSAGGSVVLITHKLRDALNHADTVTVLRQGSVTLTGSAADQTEQTLSTAMLGMERITSAFPPVRSSPERTRVVASLRNAVFRRSIEGEPERGVDLEISSGEIIGVAALEGAANKLIQVLAGRVSLSRGSAAIPDRVGFVPENRHDDALIEEFSLTENLALSGAGSRSGLMNWSLFKNTTAAVLSDFSVRARGVDATPPELSGGNQQRFVLGRELETQPDLLVMENPTQGLDLSASEFVHAEMRRAADRGAAVVFYSSDLDELAELSDRVLVVSSTGVTSIMPNRETIGRTLLGT